MEFIFKNTFFLKTFCIYKLGKSIGNNILGRNKVQNFGKDLEMLYAMNA
jgi:hypothetical protein